MLPAVIVILIIIYIIASHFHANSQIHTRFGVLAKNAEGMYYVKEMTTQITFRPDDPSYEYGIWFYRNSKKAFIAQVIHYFPQKPLFIGGDISEQSAFAQTARGISVAGPEMKYSGAAMRVFRFSSGDPVGQYQLDLLINGKHHSTIKYDVA